MVDVATTQPPVAVPSPEAVNALFELVRKASSATSLLRYLRAAEYYKLATTSARALWGNAGSLCLVYMLLQWFTQLVSHLQASTVIDEATWLEAQRLLAECRRILSARLSANTCLVGRCVAVEEDFFVRYNVMLFESDGETMSADAKAQLQRVKGRVGYDAIMQAARKSLFLVYPDLIFDGVPPPPLMGDERCEAQDFALRCVGIMATVTHVTRSFEIAFVPQIRDLLAGNYLEEPFKSELSRVWDRPALQNALRARHVFDDAYIAAHMTKTDNTLKKRGAADVAKHGLRWCALPSCAKQETHVFDFKQCSACKAVVYCSAEHGALHWTATHKKECAALKAAGAKPRSTADEAREGGAGAA